MTSAPLHSGWSRSSLFDLADYQNGRVCNQRELGDRGRPVVKIAELNNGIGGATKYFDGPLEERHLIRAGDLLFAWSASVGVYTWDGPEACLNQHIFKVTPHPGVDKTFLKYLLTSYVPVFAGIASDQATTFGHVRVADLRRIVVSVPPSSEQKQYGGLLASIDEKIASNARMSRDAASAMDAAFLQWMSVERFRLAPGDAEPWSRVSIADLATYRNGGAFTQHATGRGRAILRIAELNRGVSAKTPRTELDVPDDQVARAGDLLFSWSGSLELYVWRGAESVVNQHIFKVIPGDYPSWFVYQALRSALPSFRSIAAGKATTMGHIQRRHLEQAVVKTPDRDSMTAMDRWMQPMWNARGTAERETLRLIAMRTELVPRLMSGDIRAIQRTAG